jgi:CheY-like chemotaxis protein
MPTIFLIDDDEGFRQVTRLTLEQMGHKVMEASNGKDALERYDPQAVDLLLIDLFMPGMEGLETIMAFRDRSPRPKMIAMSGGGRTKSSDILRAAKHLGASSTLMKPFSKEGLGAAISEVLGSEDK